MDKLRARGGFSFALLKSNEEEILNTAQLMHKGKLHCLVHKHCTFFGRSVSKTYVNSLSKPELMPMNHKHMD